jgi:hypothetical protein
MIWVIVWFFIGMACYGGVDSVPQAPKRIKKKRPQSKRIVASRSDKKRTQQKRPVANRINKKRRVPRMAARRKGADYDHLRRWYRQNYGD